MSIPGKDGNNCRANSAFCSPLSLFPSPLTVARKQKARTREAPWLCRSIYPTLEANPGGQNERPPPVHALARAGEAGV